MSNTSSSKQDTFSSSNNKILNLLSLFLFNKKDFSLGELSEELNCSKQTVLRLIDEVDSSGIVQITKIIKERQNYYKINLPTKTNIRFTPEEIEQIFFCRDFMLTLLPERQKKLLSKASSKINLMGKDIQENSAIGQNLTLGQVDYTNFEQILDIFIKSIPSHTVLEIEYKAKEKQESRIHALIPMKIVAYHNNLYVKAWKVSEKGKVELLKPITFALHRIKKVWITTRIIDESEFLKNPFPEEEKSKIFGIVKEKEPFEVQIKFFPPASNFIDEKTWSYDQRFEKLSDGVLLTMSAQSELEVIKWVLGYGQEAELVSPPHLREKARKELENSVKRYKN